MKKLTTICAIVLFVAATASANGYYEFSARSGSGSEYDVDSYGNTIYYGGAASVYSVDVSIADMAKKDEPYYLADGVTLNPNYQARTFSNEKSITLAVPSGEYLKTASHGEMWVDGSYIYTIGAVTGTYTNGRDGRSIYSFDKGTGAYVATLTHNSGLPSDWNTVGYGANTLLSYGGGQWWIGDEDRRVYSSTDGKNWTSEFTWTTLGGSHGDGMEYVGGNIWVSDMTSNYLARWGEGDNPDTGAVETGWNEWNKFSYVEHFGSAKYVEGMGFGALGHFWAGSGSYIYELGGGEVGDYTEVIPAPGAILLGSIGVGLVGWLRRRRAL